MILTSAPITCPDPAGQYELFKFDPVEVASIKEAAQIYEAIRDASLLGARDFPSGLLTENGIERYTISYNGRVWGMDRTLAYDPHLHR